MSKLNKDILFLIFEELRDNPKFLFSCLMVNRVWCETVIPILWRNPWRYAIKYYNKNSLYSILTSYLSNDIKEFFAKKKINIPGQSIAFDYLSFCKSINIEIIDIIISIGSEYNRFLLKEEIYSFLMKKCPEIKYLNICGTYDILHLPEAKFRLESLCELTCHTLINPKYFYRLAHICQQIQSIIIINKNLKANPGTTKLIEFQKNLKYFEWVDEFEVENDMYYWEMLEDPYTEIFNALKKHANTLNHFQFDNSLDNYHDDGDYTFLQDALLELHNIKILKISSPLLSNNDDFNKKLEMVAYRNLEFIEIDFIYIYQNLRSLYFKEEYEKGKGLEYGDYLSNVLIKEASTNLRKIGIPHGIRFSLETLEAFFEKWKGRSAISIHLVEYYLYQTDSYMKLVDKYKIEGVIKDINI
ncbi:hypothetical protein C1646_745245 [Rhizophagus diaphanus]|nr:hypothetical protein C1646_745245 [Rhizophagus diaphanus] [Rhizophagus sp. MUCL 43196]